MPFRSCYRLTGVLKIIRIDTLASNQPGQQDTAGDKSLPHLAILWITKGAVPDFGHSPKACSVLSQSFGISRSG
jgi:hypothetical protein